LRRAYGYADFVEALSNRRHTRHRELTVWYAVPFDPDSFDARPIQLQRLGNIATRRHAGKVSHARQSRETEGGGAN
jgi:hypothetical protein